MGPTNYYSVIISMLIHFVITSRRPQMQIVSFPECENPRVTVSCESTSTLPLRCTKCAEIMPVFVLNHKNCFLVLVQFVEKSMMTMTVTT